MIAALLCLFALADEPAGEPPPGTEERPYEVVVWGEAAIRQARSQVVRRFESLGWEKVRDRKGVLVFRGPEAWMGKAHLHRDGRLEFTRPLVVARSPEALPADVPPDGEPGSDWGADLDRRESGDSVAVGVSFDVAPSRRKVRAAQEALLQGSEEQLDEYRSVLRETAYQASLQELPGRLDVLWERGEPLQGDAPLPTPQARRRAVLDYWATRADTPEGEGVRRAVELWLRQTVQPSDHPVTADEEVEAEARAGAELDLGRDR